jgi:hypothetical protein
MSGAATQAYASPAEVSSLESLFDALKRELEAMTGGDPDLTALFDAGLVDLAQAAYAGGVGAAVDALITAARTAETTNDTRLLDHGLNGPPLAMKLRPVHRRMDERNAILERIADGTYGKAPSLLGSAQKNLLEAIDLILDSFAEGLGVGGIVKEYKKVFEQAL